MLEKDDILNSQYLIEGIAGFGNTSLVYKASDLKADNADRAVKEISGPPDRLCAAISETDLMTELYSSSTKYNFIPNIINRVKTDSSLYVIMEYINGINMSCILKTAPLSYRKIMDYAKDICTFISFIHQKNKLFCNLKPDGIMILKNDAGTEKIKTARHFSSLKFIDFSSVIDKGSKISGFTPEYAAPEQYLSLFSDTYPDERSDIFNIGASLYHMATGKLPLTVHSDKGLESMELRPSYERFAFSSKDEIISGLRRIIIKCVCDDPKQRYQSCSALSRDLKALSELKHPKNCLLIAGIAAVLVIAGAYTDHLSKQNNVMSYDQYITAAEFSTDKDYKIDSLLSAIKIDNTKPKAYLKLIDACCYSIDDDIHSMLYTSDEKKKVLPAIRNNMNTLKASNIYKQIAFKYGILIWYYEEYGSENSSDNRITRMTDSVEYFEAAISTKGDEKLSEQDLEIARTYYNIGKFYKGVISSTTQPFSEDLYRNFWQDLHTIMEIISDSSSDNTLVYLETCRTSLDALDSYSSYFKDCGYDYAQQMEFFRLIRDCTEACTPDENITELCELKENIQNRYDQCTNSISMSFSSVKNNIEVTQSYDKS